MNYKCKEYKIIINKNSYEKMTETGLTKDTILKLIREHETNCVPRYKKNMRYYLGEHDIIYSNTEIELEKVRFSKKPLLKVVCNHAKAIADNIAGYFMGSPITYKQLHDVNTTELQDEELKNLVSAMDASHSALADNNNALNLSIYGCAYEYIYATPGENELNVVSLNPENVFIVIDNSIEENELFAVYYNHITDSLTNEEYYDATVMTERYVMKFKLTDKKHNGLSGEEGYDEIFEHYLGSIPVIKYKNNTLCIGDYEQQITLMDSYNTLMSDRIRDKEEFIDAILVINGQTLGESDEDIAKAKEHLDTNRVLITDEETKLSYLTRTFNEGDCETLRKSLKEDIYKFSNCPDLSDEQFAGNGSGVAMAYKLLGLNQITKTKEQYYKIGLRKRIKLFCHYMNMLGNNIDSSQITFEFSRSLPQNVPEIASSVSVLNGMVSRQTLLSLLSFVEDPKEEMARIEREKLDEAELNKELYGISDEFTLTDPEEIINDVNATNTKETKELKENPYDRDRSNDTTSRIRSLAR